MTVSQETSMDCLTVPGQPSQPRRPRRMSPRQNSLPARPSRGSSPSSASRSHGSLRGSFRRPDKQGETSHSPPPHLQSQNIFIFRFLPVPWQRYCSLDPLTWREETNISYLIIICQSLCDWYHHNVSCLIKQILISSYQTDSILNIILKY